MKNKQILILVLQLSLVLIFNSSCKKKSDIIPDCDPNAKGNYFSITQFGRDQFGLYRKEPYSLIKTRIINNKKDTAFENMLTVDWPSIFKVFFETDISNRKFLCHYNFSLFDDDVTKTRNYFYEAKDPDLFTRKLIISTDPETKKVTSIYIEAEKKTMFSFQSRKLLYEPLKIIQIQKFEKSFMKAEVNEVIQYNFP